MVSLDDLSSQLASQYRDSLSYLLPKLEQYYNSTAKPTLAEVSLLVRTWDFRGLPSLFEWDPQRLYVPPYELTIPSVKLAPGSVPVIVTIVGLVLLGVLLCFARPARSRNVNPQDLYGPLNALLAVITPSSSSWPATYLHIARHGLRSQTLSLPLSTLCNDFICGKIELRMSASTLADLMTNTLQIQDWRITLYAGASWWLRISVQITLSHLARLIPRFRPTLSALQQQAGLAQHSREAPHDKDDTQGDVKPILSDACLVQSPATGGRVTLMLDAVPYARMRAYIRVFQGSVPQNTPVMLGFSTLGSLVSSSRRSFVLVALPFLPRKYVSMNRRSQTDSNMRPYPSACRTVAPLMTSLDSIVKTLASGPSPLIIESVQNVSDQYASYLHAYVQDLTNNPGVRDRFVERWTVEGWREERFMATWEESLCRAGLLTRWVVLARK